VSDAEALGAWLAVHAGRPAPPRPPGAPAREAAAANGVAALLARALRDAGHPVDDALRQARGQEVAMALRSDGVADAVLRALSGAGIPTLALKGVAWRRALYAPRGWVRAPGDLDLLVSADQLEPARAVLDGMGFVPSDKHPPGFYRDHHHLRPLLLRGDAAIVVDLHHALLKPSHPFRVDLARMWERSVPLEGGPDEARRLDDLDLCLHTVLQVDHDDAYGGKGRAMLDLLLWRATRSLDDGAIAERAAEMGAETQWRRFRSALTHVFGIPAPPDARGGAWARILPRAAWRRDRDVPRVSSGERIASFTSRRASRSRRRLPQLHRLRHETACGRAP